MISPSATISHLLAELWVMEPIHLEQFLTDLVVRVDNFAFGGELKSDQAPAYRVDSKGVAHIEINGVILKDIPWIFDFLGIAATSTGRTKDALRQALADDEVKEICFDIDSPGGTVAGVQELADEIYKSRDKKPISAHASDLMASAAYWIGSQAEKLSAGKGAVIGSIGVYSVMYDSSKAAENRGVKVHVIRSHELKGAGVDGSPITDKQLASQQKLVDSLASLFVSEVARGRDKPEKTIRESATGETWLATEAKSRGLIDKVGLGEEPEEEDPEEPAEDDKEKEPPKPPEEPEDEPTDDEEDGQKPAPKGATTKGDRKMDKTKATADELTTRAQKAEERADLAEAKLEDLRRSLCANVIEKAVGEGKVIPAIRKDVEDFAESVGFDTERLRNFVSAMPVQTHPNTDSEQPSEDNADEPETGLAAMPKEDQALIKSFGLNNDDVEKYGDVNAVGWDGQAYREDGTEKEVN